jgi:competence protein ComEA
MSAIKEWLGKHLGMVAAFLMAVILVGVVLIQLLPRRSTPSILPSPTLPPTPGPTATPGPIRVYVSGAVQDPDVYELEADSIVKDVVMAAGGATDEADLDRINLAQPLADGMHVYVPRQGEETTPVQLPASRSGSMLVNINTADTLELESLPGIGPAHAQSILEYRDTHGPFARIEDITEVSGIGPATLERLQDLITVE